MKKRSSGVFHKRSLDPSRISSLAKFRRERRAKNRNIDNINALDIRSSLDSDIESEIGKTKFSERFSLEYMQDIYNYLNTAL